MVTINYGQKCNCFICNQTVWKDSSFVKETVLSEKREDYENNPIGKCGQYICIGCMHKYIFDFFIERKAEKMWMQRQRSSELWETMFFTFIFALET